MAQRKTIRSFELPVLLLAITNVVAVIAMGFLVHQIMWARISADEASALPKTPPAPRIRISSRTLAA